MQRVKGLDEDHALIGFKGIGAQDFNVRELKRSIGVIVGVLHIKGSIHIRTAAVLKRPLVRIDHGDYEGNELVRRICVRLQAAALSVHDRKFKARAEARQIIRELEAQQGIADARPGARYRGHCSTQLEVDVIRPQHPQNVANEPAALDIGVKVAPRRIRSHELSIVKRVVFLRQGEFIRIAVQTLHQADLRERVKHFSVQFRCKYLPCDPYGIGLVSKFSFVK